jgi:type IV secretory pathway VirJ component
MKKIFIVLPIIMALTACGTTDKFGRIAEQEQKTRVKSQEKILDETPKWYNKIEVSNSAVFETGYGKSWDMDDADTYAMHNAYSRLCMTAGGKFQGQTKTYSSESENSRTQLNERVGKSYCPSVDLTGAYKTEVKRIVTPDGRVVSFVQLVLPTGDANILARARDAKAERELAMRRAPEAFKELDNNR